MKYVNHDDYTVTYDFSTHKFNIFYKKMPIITDATVTGLYRNLKKVRDITDFGFVTAAHSATIKEDGTKMDIVYKMAEDSDEIAFSLNFFASNDGVYIKSQKYDVKIEGKIFDVYDDINDIFPVCVDRDVKDVRSALGEAVSNVDNAIYNKMTDMAVVAGKSRTTKITFDRQKGQYRFNMPIMAADERNSNVIFAKENVLADKYHITFSPYNRNCTFKTPPIGWMTWYAVKFRASEETVLKNAKWQADNLKDYGANTIWVDWEWYHENFAGDRTDGVNSLNPDPKKYPNGLKYVSDKIKEMGLVPALWIGCTNEPSMNKYIEEHPEMVLVDEKQWCGRYFLDFSNPHFLNEYLPDAVGKVHEWGYEAAKFDTIPSAINRHNQYHEKMYDPSLTTKEAYHNMIKKTREILGENMYMLSCSGASNSSILWAADIFDAARIGDDIFTWKEHLINIGRIEEFYPLHNIQLHVDADNVVIRSEFNNFEQAKARATIISLLGLPMTFGDEFEVLSEDRVDILKRSLPILDIHPMDMSKAKFDDDNLLINLNIAKEYENYLVTGAYNLTDTDSARKISLTEDLHLEEGTYLVYDYFRDAFLGKVTDNIELDFVPYEARILSVRKFTDKPQIISTSRHITQGAAEIKNMQTVGSTISVTADLVANDTYTVTFYVPDGYALDNYTGFHSHTENENLVKLTFIPDETKEYKFSVSFKK